MRATLKDRAIIAYKTLEVSFELVEPVSFRAGQSFKLTLLNPGSIDRFGDSRFFSITNPPAQDSVLSTAMRIRDSAFKKSIALLPLGSAVEISNLGGVFVLPETAREPLVLIAGGIGITPFMSMLRHIREKKVHGRVVLFYTNRDKKSSAYLDELQTLAKSDPHFTLIATMTRDPRWKGERRRIDAKFIKDYISGFDTGHFYVSGSFGMVSYMFNLLTTLEVEPKRIQTEEFSGY